MSQALECILRYTGLCHTDRSHLIGRLSFFIIGQKWKLGKKQWKAQITSSLEFSSFIWYCPEFTLLCIIHYLVQVLVSLNALEILIVKHFSVNINMDV